MRIVETKVKELVFTEEELDMLERVSKIKEDYCHDRTNCVNCPFHNTYFCVHVKGQSRTVWDRTARITVEMKEQED